MKFRILSCVVAAALSVPAMPAAAGAGATPTTAMLSNYAVDHFYQSRDGAPLWLRSPSTLDAAERLVEVLERADLDGFDQGPDLARRIETALQRARFGDESDARNADRLISSAWVDYVQAISWPSSGMIYGDQAMVPRIPAGTEILRAAAEAQSLERHVEQLSTINPIYAELRDAAWNAKITGDSALQRRIMTNMERARALPSGGRFVLVDVAAQKLWMYEDGRPVDSMKVVVGKTGQQTPLVASSVRHAVLNPYWHVPVDMVRTLIAPNVLREGPAYLEARGYQVVSDYGEDPQLIPPAEVDWQAVADGSADALVRQRPGPGNAMGDLKIMFDNRAGIYLHDTPDKHLFEEAQRTFSGGCIRLEDAPRLARWLLGRDSIAPSPAPEQQVNLPQPVPIYVTYLTVSPGRDGELAFREDVYGLDEHAGTALAER